MRARRSAAQTGSAPTPYPTIWTSSPRWDLYVGLGTVSTTAGASVLDLTPNLLDTSVDLTARIGRVGINYKF